MIRLNPALIIGAGFFVLPVIKIHHIFIDIILVLNLAGSHIDEGYISYGAFPVPRNLRNEMNFIYLDILEINI